MHMHMQVQCRQVAMHMHMQVQCRQVSMHMHMHMQAQTGIGIRSGILHRVLCEGLASDQDPGSTGSAGDLGSTGSAGDLGIYGICRRYRISGSAGDLGIYGFCRMALTRAVRLARQAVHRARWHQKARSLPASRGEARR
jgi:hypothetical protein